MYRYIFTDLQVAVGIDKQVSRFLFTSTNHTTLERHIWWFRGLMACYQIAVDDARRVQVLEGPHNLVDEELDVFIPQKLWRLDDHSQIGFHQLHDYIAVW